MFLMTQQFFKFLFVGGLGFATNYVVFLLLVSYIGIQILPSAVISFLIAALQNFIFNSCFTFGFRMKSLTGFVKKYFYFLCGALLGLSINLFFVSTLMPIVDNVFIAQFISLCIVSIFNYIYSKCFVFKVPA